MSPRITRSCAARLAATEATEDNPASIDVPTARKRPGTSTSASSTAPTPARKRKAADISPPTDGKAEAKHIKRARTEKPASPPQRKRQDQRLRRHSTEAMSSAAPTSGESTETSSHAASRDTSSKKKSHGRRSKDSQATAAVPSSRKSKRGSRKDHDTLMKDSEEEEKKPESKNEDTLRENDRLDADPRADNAEASLRRFTEDFMERPGAGDPFSGGYLSRLMGHSGLAGLSGHLRALSGMTSGTGTRLRGILEQLKMKEDPSIQLIALQELSELLLVSTEDNLAGHFAPDQFVKELVLLMQPNELTGEENPEMMLLACRCIANMMEALPAATASVVYGGAVPVLCQKLLEIHFIDLAEQALSTLEKISVDFPSSIVREGGLTACLTYLDFFATSTQRTAVTTAANCCRNINEDSFPTVRDVMPTLLNTLSSSDQRVVEQASLCVSRIVDSFKYSESKLEELISPDLLKAILRLLLPGSTNMISTSTHTSFLRLLSITARASPRLSVDLLKMDLVGTLYQILTGVSLPSVGEDNLAAKIDKNVIMQAIIRTPRDQVFETLNVICEILPSAAHDDLDLFDHGLSIRRLQRRASSHSEKHDSSPNIKRIQLLQECTAEVRAFTVVLFPTLVHAYSSTVNLHVRQKVLTAQLKMLSNLDTKILEEALRGVTYASHIASILSQQDNPTLITYALQAAELLLKRLGSIYQAQFLREGVYAEIDKLATRQLKVSESEKPGEPKTVEDAKQETDVPDNPADAMDLDIGDVTQASRNDVENEHGSENGAAGGGGGHEEDIEVEEEEEDDDDDDDDDDDEDDDDDDEEEEDDNDGQHDEGGSELSDQSFARYANRGHLPDAQDIVTLRARRFMEAHGKQDSADATTTSNVDRLQALSKQLATRYAKGQQVQELTLFEELAKHFHGDSLESITSYELMTSGIVDALLEVLNVSDQALRLQARQDFAAVFMTADKSAHPDATPFAILVHKLQDLLSRSEQFEVVTVHHNAFESNRAGAASMLAKQLRLQLVADDESGIPKPYRRIMVSIHAIATFKALDDYLRPRISLLENPRHDRIFDHGGDLPAYLAAMRTGHSLANTPPLPTAASPSAPKGRAVTTERADAKPAADETHSLRRSSRKHSSHSKLQDDEVAPHSLLETAADLPTGNQLECADETHFTENEDHEDEADFEAEIDALVEDFDDEVLEDESEPSAVNMELGQSGKVTARTDDGARISTPSQQSTPVSAVDQDRLTRAHAKLAGGKDVPYTPSSMSSSSRLMSYASALQSVPKDWHIEFSINGQPLSNDTTIYRACHFNQAQSDNSSARGVWSATHNISYKRVDGPPRDATETTSQVVASSLLNDKTDLPGSLSQHPVTAAILRLMSILHDMNLHLDEITAEMDADTRYITELPTHFVNAKLTAKLNRQLEEPLIVASNCLPPWSEDLARLYPFLFPFETRHLYLSSTSFGYSRSMTRWQNAQPAEGRHSRHHRDERPFLGRLQRQKVRISRHRILESALKVMDMYGSSPSILEVEYFEEVGTGLGPTLEFYSSVSREFSKKKTKLWRDDDSLSKGDFAFGKKGLFPAPMTEESSKSETGQRVLHLFKTLGKFIARSMLDSRIIDVSFNPAFFRIGHINYTLSLPAVAAVDQDLARSLKMLRGFADARKRIEGDVKLDAGAKAAEIAATEVKGAKLEDLALDFVLPGYEQLELVRDGASQAVTMENIDKYIESVTDLTLGSGVQRQFDAFRAGFSQVFPFDALGAFTPDELVMLFGRTQEDWSLETLMDSVKADHGYNLDSKSVKNLLQTMSEFTEEERRGFLQFVTGSPKLPIGGFRSLTPMFTVVCKPAEAPLTSDDYLPSVMTCVNYLKMPDYSSPKTLREKLRVAIKEGQGSFHLS